MATRMQQRRGTAAQWVSTNAGAGPVLNAGEIGWESDTNKFKIGDGTNNWSSLEYFADIDSTVNPAFGTSITFEGATADSFETVLQVTDPTADRTITLPNVTGTVITTGNLSDITDIGVFTSTIVMEGSSADAHELTLSAGNPTADRTITFPDSTGTVALTSDIAAGVVTETGTQTLTNKTLTSPIIATVLNGAATITMPVTTGTVALTSDVSAATGGSVSETGTQTLTNKTISLGSNTVTSTLAQLNTAISDADVVSLAGSETLTNKTLTGPVLGGTTTTASGNLAVQPATYVLEVKGGGATEGAIQLNCSANSHGQIVKSQPHAQNATNTLLLPGGTTIGNSNAVLVSDIGTQTLTNKTISFSTNTLTGVAPLAAPALTGDATAVNLTISGNLTVNGTTTNINSTNLVVEDKNIILGDAAEPTDVTADGGGITLKGTSDKTFNWVDSTDSWTSSEHINLASGKSYSMNGTALKDVSETLANKSISFGSNTITSTLAQLNTAVSDADLVSLAGSETLTNKTLSSAVATTALTLNATAELRLADTDSTHYVGFKAPGTVSANKIWTLPAADGTAGQVLSTDGSGTFSFSTPAAGAAFSELMLIGA